VNTVGISGSALFVPYLIFVFPWLATLLAPDALVSAHLAPETIVTVGLISESFGLSSSAPAFIQHGLVDRKLALSLVGGAVPFVAERVVRTSPVPVLTLRADGD
jgi:uncharacterized membrane protein YfcA